MVREQKSLFIYQWLSHLMCPSLDHKKKRKKSWQKTVCLVSSPWDFFFELFPELVRKLWWEYERIFLRHIFHWTFLSIYENITLFSHSFRRVGRVRKNSNQNCSAHFSSLFAFGNFLPINKLFILCLIQLRVRCAWFMASCAWVCSVMLNVRFY